MDGSLIVVDMRGPKIILSHEVNKKNKHKLHVRTHGGDGPSSSSSAPDIAKSLTWTISLLDKGKLFFLSYNCHANLFLCPSKIAS
jgi:syntaxin-binding protein 5